jgi:hypothetical protein
MPREGIGIYPHWASLTGQFWCYKGGEDSYRLGYIDRDAWFSPIFFGHVVSTKGEYSSDSRPLPAGHRRSTRKIQVPGLGGETSRLLAADA